MPRRSIRRRIRRINRSTLVAVAVAAVVLVGSLLAGGWYAVRAHLTKTNGVVLVTRQEKAPGQVAFFLQNDPAWAEQTLGSSGYRMGGSGCLVSCIASALCAMGVDTDPGRVNQAFSAAGVYDDGGNVIWKNISRAFPSVGYRYSRIFDSSRIEADLRAGLRPLLGVAYLGGRAQHWVEVVGAANGDFLVMDPLVSDKLPTPLSRHGNVFYYRVLVPAS